MVKGGEIGGFGGGWLEHPRQWLGAQWAGLFLGVPRAARCALRRHSSRATALPRGALTVPQRLQLRLQRALLWLETDGLGRDGHLGLGVGVGVG